MEESTPEGERLRRLLPAFLSRRCIDAFLGYAQNQERKFRMEQTERKWKYAASQVRVLLQLSTLLETGQLSGTYSKESITLLRGIRRGEKTDTEIMTVVFDLEQRCRKLALKSPLSEKPNIEAIEEFLVSVYKSK